MNEEKQIRDVMNQLEAMATESEQIDFWLQQSPGPHQEVARQELVERYTALVAENKDALIQYKKSHDLILPWAPGGWDREPFMEIDQTASPSQVVENYYRARWAYIEDTWTGDGSLTAGDAQEATGDLRLAEEPYEQLVAEIGHQAVAQLIRELPCLHLGQVDTDDVAYGMVETLDTEFRLERLRSLSNPGLIREGHKAQRALDRVMNDRGCDNILPESRQKAAVKQVFAERNMPYEGLVVQPRGLAMAL